MTGPKNDTPSTEITGVPTSMPTRVRATAVEARSSSSYAGSVITAASSTGNPAVASAVSMVSRVRSCPRRWNASPMAV